ncbi:hypothetical protein [Arthrobacter sp. NPDC089319]|uniref:hypothetical protein n=1 Tax=Arthrobacter sp. NPDC089319 TaxID=3155915 RepID=UPI003435CD01
MPEHLAHLRPAAPILGERADPGESDRPAAGSEASKEAGNKAMVVPAQSRLQRFGGRFRALLNRQAAEIQSGTELPPADPYQTLLNSLRSTYPGARLSLAGNGKVRVELPGGDVLRFYVKG